MTRHTVEVKISGKEYAVRTDEDEAWLQQVAGLVDEKMAQIRDRTGMVDSFDVAMLTCLNLAKEVHEHRMCGTGQSLHVLPAGESLEILASRFSVRTRCDR